ncbi:glycoside hydrolase [Meredithblackwellia eburnea MCA 4105]
MEEEDERDVEEVALGRAAGAGAAGTAAGAARRRTFNAQASQRGPGSSGSRSRGAAGGAGGGGGFFSRLSSRARKWLIVAIVLAIVLVAVIVAVPVAITQSNNKSQNAKAATTGASSSGKGSSSGSGSSAGAQPTSSDPRQAYTGGDGSTVYASDGTSFIYNNSFGGFWNSIPLNDSAQPQSYVPPLNQKWDYSTNLIHGVNIGGWLVIEPFIVPSLFEPFNSASNSPNATNNAIDEWDLCLQLGTSMASTIENHYATFITEKDFAEIAGAGLNWVRIPIGYWAIEVWSGEPFLANVAWTYFLKAITWARKYGIRINLDLHAVPGSQNGYNHSSKQGTINFLNGVMGVANAQRTLNYIRTLTEFITQPEYVNVIPMFSVLNEPYAATIGVDVLRHFYLETYNLVRGISGIGEGNGPFIAFHDGFVDQAVTVAAGGWDGFLTGADRMAIDSHPYLCFSTPSNDGLAYQASKPCSYWATKVNISSQQFGLSIGGEWSLAINDCGKWLNNVGNGNRFDGTYYTPGTNTIPYAGFGAGACDVWNNWPAYTAATKAGLQGVANAHIDALRHWFFWTWKTGYSNTLGMIANPLWNYQLALEQGYMPKDPRQALGSCPSIVAAQGVSMSMDPAPSLSAWMTGGAGAGTIVVTDQLTSYSAWPPVSLGTTPAANLPTYTPTAKVITMSASTPTSFPAGYSTTVNVGNGWADASDNAGWYTAVAGCSYPNPWSGVEATIPAAACTGSGSRAKKRAQVPLATPTPAPSPSSARV